jgi:signal transduction histidine kinase
MRRCLTFACQVTDDVKSSILRLDAWAAGRGQTVIDDEQIEGLQRLSAGLSHDYMNLLTVISGNIQLARSRIADPQTSKLLAEAELACDMGARLSQQLMTFAQRRHYRLVHLDLNDVLKASQAVLARAAGDNANLTVTLSKDPCPLCVDHSELERALLNLFLNARDAIGEGGIIRITSERAVETGASLDTQRYVRLTVSDTGTGMTDYVRQRALDPFFTTKDVGQGSGLGLATVHGFVRQAGGTLRLDSSVGSGTTVTIDLPMVEPPRGP